MDGDEREVSVWMQQLSADDPEALRQIWDYCYRRVAGFADRRLGNFQRRDADEEDIASSVLHSLYVGVKNGRFPDFANRQDLWRILLTLAGRKVSKRIRNQTNLKRGGGNVRGESLFGLPADDNRGGLDQIPDRMGDWVETFSLECQELLEQLPDPTLREVATLRLQGYSKQEIADHLKCVVRSVERKLNLIREIWQVDHDSHSD